MFDNNYVNVLDWMASIFIIICGEANVSAISNLISEILLSNFPISYLLRKNFFKLRNNLVVLCTH